MCVMVGKILVARNYVDLNDNNMSARKMLLKAVKYCKYDKISISLLPFIDPARWFWYKFHETQCNIYLT